jgi:hypothetical protein
MELNRTVNAIQIKRINSTHERVPIGLPCGKDFLRDGFGAGRRIISVFRAFIPLIFPLEKQKFIGKNPMDSEQNTENQQESAAERPAGEQSAIAQPHTDPSVGDKPVAARPPGSGPRDNRRGRGGRGRSRFKRDNRGDGGDRGNREGDRERGDREGDREDRGQQPRPPVRERVEVPFRQPSGTIARALEQVDNIRMELSKVLEEMEEVLQTLDQVEREKNASEAEIEKLRDALRSLHRVPSYPRNPRNEPPYRGSAMTSGPPETDAPETESPPPPEEESPDSATSEHV